MPADFVRWNLRSYITGFKNVNTLWSVLCYQLSYKFPRAVPKQEFTVVLLVLKKSSRNFPDGLVLKDPPRNEGTWVQSLTRELRSHMPQSKEACIPCNERSLVSQRSPNTAK